MVSVKRLEKSFFFFKCDESIQPFCCYLAYEFEGLSNRLHDQRERSIGIGCFPIQLVIFALIGFVDTAFLSDTLMFCLEEFESSSSWQGL